jgi:hypothetical protein
MFGSNGAISGNQINANYADVAERFEADEVMLPGTVVELGGVNEITQVNIDLSEKNESKCIEVDKNGLCDKPAKFRKEGKCYCLKHSKKQNYLQPTKELTSSYLNKQKIENSYAIIDSDS